MTFFPTFLPFTKFTTDDYFRQAAKVIIEFITAPPTTIPILEAGNETRNGLLTLAPLLNTAEELPTPTTITETIQPQRVSNKVVDKLQEQSLIPIAQRLEEKKSIPSTHLIEREKKTHSYKGATISGQVDQIPSRALQQMYYLHNECFYFTYELYT